MHSFRSYPGRASNRSEISNFRLGQVLQMSQGALLLPAEGGEAKC